MKQDRYRHWYSVEDTRPLARPIMAPGVRDLEELVLQDLAKAETGEEKLEILDSYSLAAQRYYRNSLHQTILDYSQRVLVTILKPMLGEYLPEPQPPYHRTYKVGKVTEEKDS